MVPTYKVLASVIPLSMLIFYGIIRFTTLPQQTMEKLNIARIALIRHNKLYKAIDDGILTSNIYEPNFQLIQKNVCPDFGQHLQMLVIVQSKVYHVSRRMAIRKTWGHYALKNGISIAFLFGSRGHVNNTETIAYSDMIIERNIDSDVNRTLKSISLMEFVSTNCSKVQYVYKTKDDMFVNIPALLNVITKLNETTRALYGHLRCNNTVVRDRTSKMYISYNQYNLSVLPNYLTGGGYLFPGHIAGDIYKESLRQIYIPLEEVFLTGIVAEKLGIKRIDPGKFKHVHHVRDLDGRKYFAVNFKAEVPSKQYTYWMKFNTFAHKQLMQSIF